MPLILRPTTFAAITVPVTEGGTGAVCDSNSSDSGETDLVAIWVPAVIISVAVIGIAGAAGLVLIVYLCRRDSKRALNASNVYYTEREESVRSSRSPSRSASTCNSPSSHLATI